METLKAFGYLRVSGRGQVDGDGFPRQRDAIERYAAANGIEIVRWFEERAVTGTTEWDARAAWGEMMGSLNGTRTVLIEKLDRLARDLMVQEHIIADLRKRGVTLISAAEPDLCVDDPTRKLLRQIMGAIAEYDRAMVVLKLKASRKRKRDAVGKCEGQKFFGCKADRPDEAGVLARMVELRGRGESFSQIARTLNADRVPTRHGQPWAITTVRKILVRSANA